MQPLFHDEKLSVSQPLENIMCDNVAEEMEIKWSWIAIFISYKQVSSYKDQHLRNTINYSRWINCFISKLNLYKKETQNCLNQDYKLGISARGIL